MDIVQALGLVQKGAEIRRASWKKGMKIVQDKHVNLKGHAEPIFLFVTSTGNRSFLNLYAGDLNAQDWDIVL